MSAVKVKVIFGEGKMEIILPPLQSRSIVKFPVKSTVCTITFGITFFRLQDGYKLYQPHSVQLVLDNDETSITGHRFEFELPAGCLCIMGTFLNYRSSNSSYGYPMNTVSFNPAGICAAVVTPGEYVEEGKFKWVDMLDLKFESQ